MTRSSWILLMLCGIVGCSKPGDGDTPKKAPADDGPVFVDPLSARAELLQTKAEIAELDIGLEAFKMAYAVSYVPSQFHLKSVYQPGGGPLEQASFNYLTKLFGRNMAYHTTYEWIVGEKNTNVVLQGPQCLVFFLGGVVDATGPELQCKGFGVTKPTDTSRTNGPFAPFKAKRLRREANGGFFYLDTFDMPFLFFGVDTIMGWQAVAMPALAPNILKDVNGKEFKIGDVSPYMASVKTPVNQERWQIISAGPNKKFGPGGTAWNPKDGYGGKNADGDDDIANFSKTPLGKGDGQ